MEELVCYREWVLAASQYHSRGTGVPACPVLSSEAEETRTPSGQYKRLRTLSARTSCLVLGLTWLFFSLTLIHSYSPGLTAYADSFQPSSSRRNANASRVV